MSRVANQFALSDVNRRISQVKRFSKSTAYAIYHFETENIIAFADLEHIATSYAEYLNEEEGGPTFRVKSIIKIT